MHAYMGHCLQFPDLHNHKNSGVDHHREDLMEILLLFGPPSFGNVLGRSLPQTNKTCNVRLGWQQPSHDVRSCLPSLAINAAFGVFI